MSTAEPTCSPRYLVSHPWLAIRSRTPQLRSLEPSSLVGEVRGSLPSTPTWAGSLGSRAWEGTRQRGSSPRGGWQSGRQSRPRISLSHLPCTTRWICPSKYDVATVASPSGRLDWGAASTIALHRRQESMSGCMGPGNGRSAAAGPHVMYEYAPLAALRAEWMGWIRPSVRTESSTPPPMPGQSVGWAPLGSTELEHLRPHRQSCAYPLQA